MTIADLLSAAVLAVVVVRLVAGVRHSRRATGRTLRLAVLRRVTPRHVLSAVPLLAVVVAAGWLLMSLPVLDRGWWTAIGGDGNPVFGSTERSSGTVLEWAVPLLFIGLLVPALPLFALAEERVFRRGAEHWSRWRRLAKALQFGLVHTVVGIPIGAAAALSLGGGWFTVVYLREWRRTGDTESATLASAAAHTAYNAVIIALVLVATVAAAVTDLRR